MQPLGMFSRGAFFCLCLLALSSIAFAGMTGQRIPSKPFSLASNTRFTAPGEDLTVYIEGDGRAFLNRSRASWDPTPTSKTVREMATLDPSPNVAYLARPCQYDESAEELPCEQAYWTEKRFAPEVIASTNQALDELKEQAGASKIHLIGYSGGGAVAVLVAARRQDVASIRTVAGNLDPGEISRKHNVPLLEGSLDPMEVAASIAHIPQRHFIGEKDDVVPASVGENFRKVAGGKCIQVTPIDASHHQGWEERWKTLLKLPVECS